MSLRKIRLTNATVVVTLLLAASPASAISSSEPPAAGVEREATRLVLVAKRTTEGSSSFELFVSAATDQGAFIGSMSAAVASRRFIDVQPGHATSFGEGIGVTTYSGGESTCHGPNCESSLGMGFQFLTFDDPSGDDPTSHYFIGMEGADLRYDFKGTGWKIEEVPWSFGFVEGRDSDAEGASIWGSGAEVFRGAEAPGGRFGSIAMGIPPCSGTTTGVVRRGAGEVTLTGGVEEETTSCPPPDSQPQVASWATKKTTWNLSGTMAGDTSLNTTRLFVIDLPRRYLSR